MPLPMSDLTTASGQSDAGVCSRVDSRPEVPFSELPDERNVQLHDGIGCVIPSGAMLEVWRIKGEEGFSIKIRRPLEDGRQSVLRFGLTKEAALALHGLLDQQIYPENVDVKARPRCAFPRQDSL